MNQSAPFLSSLGEHLSLLGDGMKTKEKKKQDLSKAHDECYSVFPRPPLRVCRASFQTPPGAAAYMKQSLNYEAQEWGLLIS